MKKYPLFCNDSNLPNTLAYKDICSTLHPIRFRSFHVFEISEERQEIREILIYEANLQREVNEYVNIKNRLSYTFNKEEKRMLREKLKSLNYIKSVVITLEELFESYRPIIDSIRSLILSTGKIVNINIRNIEIGRYIEESYTPELNSIISDIVSKKILSHQTIYYPISYSNPHIISSKALMLIDTYRENLFINSKNFYYAYLILTDKQIEENQKIALIGYHIKRVFIHEVIHLGVKGWDFFSNFIELKYNTRVKTSFISEIIDDLYQFLFITYNPDLYYNNVLNNLFDEHFNHPREFEEKYLIGTRLIFDSLFYHESTSILLSLFENNFDSISSFCLELAPTDSNIENFIDNLIYKKIHILYRNLLLYEKEQQVLFIKKDIEWSQLIEEFKQIYFQINDSKREKPIDYHRLVYKYFLTKNNHKNKIFLTSLIFIDVALKFIIDGEKLVYFMNLLYDRYQVFTREETHIKNILNRLNK